MFELFMLTALFGIGMSQFLPEDNNQPRKGGRPSQTDRREKRRRDQKGRKEKDNKTIRFSWNRQAQASITRLNSSAGTGRLKKKPCIW